MADQWKLSAAMVAESEERSYVLQVQGYSRTKAVFRSCEYLSSPPLSVGGHSFVFRYFPNGDMTEHAGYVCFSLVLDSADHTKDVKVKTGFSLIDKDGLPVRPLHYRRRLCTGDVHVLEDILPRTTGYYLQHAALEGSAHIIVDDRLSVRFDVTVEKDIHSGETTGDRFVVVPPSDLQLHFGKLLESMDGADVTFHVGAEMFLAHRFVLAARSSVFKAELFGNMKENAGGDPIVIQEMEPVAFRCLLHFLYTDSLLALDVVMAQHLLEAADRYDVERLKLICAHKLCSNIDANMVAASLVLADKHNCHGLKEACLEFLASNSNLEAIKASGGYDHLNISCPSVVKELIASLLPVEMKAAKDIVMAL